MLESKLEEKLENQHNFYKMGLTKTKRRERIRKRIRKTISGNSLNPRLSVFRSNKEIYAQLIDDVESNTLASASSREQSVSNEKSTKVEQAKLVGKLIAERAKSSGIENVVFDRGGFLYHGRVKALADSAREAGLNF